MDKHGQGKPMIRRLGRAAMYGAVRGAATTLGASGTAALIWWFQTR
ncbi:hypothetical protein GCM10022295_07700 [Streptomyces osmaniensis]|uniref:Uncharacterized protein n=1 Tax=Streptomyces osmaniensis TaxID=593134 RepID=A0ABP6V4B5_9ACTN